MAIYIRGNENDTVDQKSGLLKNARFPNLPSNENDTVDTIKTI